MDVNWTSFAYASFEDEIEFILKKWNLKEVENFVNLVDDFAVRLSNNPYNRKEIYKKTDKNICFI